MPYSTNNHVQLQRPGSVPKKLQPFPVWHFQMSILYDEAVRFLCDVGMLGRYARKMGLIRTCLSSSIHYSKEGRRPMGLRHSTTRQILLRTIYGSPRESWHHGSAQQDTLHLLLRIQFCWPTFYDPCYYNTFRTFRSLPFPMSICNRQHNAGKTNDKHPLRSLDRPMEKLQTALTTCLDHNNYIFQLLKWAVLQATDWLGYRPCWRISHKISFIP